MNKKTFIKKQSNHFADVSKMVLFTFILSILTITNTNAFYNAPNVDINNFSACNDNFNSQQLSVWKNDIATQYNYDEINDKLIIRCANNNRDVVFIYSSGIDVTVGSKTGNNNSYLEFGEGIHLYNDKYYVIVKNFFNGQWYNYSNDYTYYNQELNRRTVINIDEYLGDKGTPILYYQNTPFGLINLYNVDQYTNFSSYLYADNSNYLPAKPIINYEKYGNTVKFNCLESTFIAPNDSTFDSCTLYIDPSENDVNNGNEIFYLGNDATGTVANVLASDITDTQHIAVGERCKDNLCPSEEQKYLTYTFDNYGTYWLKALITTNETQLQSVAWIQVNIDGTTNIGDSINGEVIPEDFTFECVSLEFPYININECNQMLSAITNIITFNEPKISITNSSMIYGCHTLIVLDDWLNLPDDYQLCPQIPEYVRDTITPFMTLFVGMTGMYFISRMNKEDY